MAICKTIVKGLVNLKKNIFETLPDLNDIDERKKTSKNSNRVKSYASFKFMQMLYFIILNHFRQNKIIK